MSISTARPPSSGSFSLTSCNLRGNPGGGLVIEERDNWAAFWPRVPFGTALRSQPALAGLGEAHEPAPAVAQ
jgi:hypothetical protein